MKIKYDELILDLEGGGDVRIAAVPVEDMPRSVGYLRFEKDGEYLFSIDCKDIKALKFLKDKSAIAIKTAVSVS